MMEGHPEVDTTFFHLLTYQPLVNLTVGLLCNTIAFIMFRFHSDFSSSSTMVFLSFVSITDSLSLFGWQFDHYLNYNQYISVFTLNKPLCRISWFNQFFSLEASAFLLSFMSVDRYIHVASLPGSRLSRLPFRTAKTAFWWSVVIISLIAILNSHTLIFGCFYLHSPENTTNMSQIDIVFQTQLTAIEYENGFRLYNTWEQIHVILYVLVPFAIMAISNCLIIKSVIQTSANKSKSNLWGRMSNTFLTVIVNLVFLCMALPANITFSFNLTTNRIIMLIVDEIGFSNHSSLFFTCFLTHRRFRKKVISHFNDIWQFICKLVNVVTKRTT